MKKFSKILAVAIIAACLPTIGFAYTTFCRCCPAYGTLPPTITWTVTDPDSSCPSSVLGLEKIQGHIPWSAVHTGTTTIGKEFVSFNCYDQVFTSANNGSSWADEGHLNWTHGVDCPNDYYCDNDNVTTHAHDFFHAQECMTKGVTNIKAYYAVYVIGPDSAYANCPYSVGTGSAYTESTTKFYP